VKGDILAFSKTELLRTNCSSMEKIDGFS